jgi:hypothetical protein
MNHPYKQYEGTELWKILSDVLDELNENQDITMTTKREYIVGYMCRKLSKIVKI